MLPIGSPGDAGPVSTTTPVVSVWDLGSSAGRRMPPQATTTSIAKAPPAALRSVLRMHCA
jgi:hypothetical protein